MNIAFCSNFEIKTDKFFLPKDSIDDRKSINAVLKELSGIMEHPKINPVWKDYKLEFTRRATKDSFSFTINPTVMKSSATTPRLEPIPFKYKLLEHFSALECFNALSYSLAEKLNKISRDLPLSTDIFRHVAEKLYNIRL